MLIQTNYNPIIDVRYSLKAGRQGHQHQIGRGSRQHHQEVLKKETQQEAPQGAGSGIQLGTQKLGRITAAIIEAKIGTQVAVKERQYSRASPRKSLET